MLWRTDWRTTAVSDVSYCRWGICFGLYDQLHEQQQVRGVFEVARELLEAHSPNGWDPDQILRSGGDQISAGTFWWQAQQHGYRRLADD